MKEEESSSSSSSSWLLLYAQLSWSRSLCYLLRKLFVLEEGIELRDNFGERKKWSTTTKKRNKIGGHYFRLRNLILDAMLLLVKIFEKNNNELFRKPLSQILCWRNESNRIETKWNGSNRIESRERIGKIEEKVNDNNEEAYGLLCHCHWLFFLSRRC